MKRRAKPFFQAWRTPSGDYRRPVLREFKVEANVEDPRWPTGDHYKVLETEGRFIRQSGGEAVRHVWLTIEPQPAGKG